MLSWMLFVPRHTVTVFHASTTKDIQSTRESIHVYVKFKVKLKNLQRYCFFVKEFHLIVRKRLLYFIIKNDLYHIYTSFIIIVTFT